MNRNRRMRVVSCWWLLLCTLMSSVGWGQEMAESLRESVEEAVARVKPALVQIHVVLTRYSEGRELKMESVGSGVVISQEGHVLTNHHVAGHATRLVCTFSDKDEVEAELVGTDPLTDIAVLKLVPDEAREFPVAQFGDSDGLYVGEYVLAMGCPMALSHSVTLGIVSNTQMVMPQMYGSGLELDGEDVGALVRWIAHDAEIHGGNSGGPLVNLLGQVVGINEIRVGLAGAIPGNLAQTVAQQLIAHGEVRRGWVGFDVQPLLKRARGEQGVLISGTIDGGPAAEAGLTSGDILVRVGDTPVSVRFPEELPGFNRLITDLPAGEPVQMAVLRAGQEKTFAVTPIMREAMRPKEHEYKQWGITARNLSLIDAKELKRETRDGVLVTSVRPGGPAGEAKPAINAGDILTSIDGQPVADIEGFGSLTHKLTEGQSEPVPSLAGFERKTDDLVTVVRVGIRDLPDPALQVKKAWLPVETQVVTRDIATVLEREDLTGFRITKVYPGSTAETAGLQVGDVILSVDDERMTASAPEHYEELPAFIREYKIGATAALTILRDGQESRVPVQLVRAPEDDREMKKYRDENFEFTVRNVSFFDRAREKWSEEQRGVIVDEVKPGGWAALGDLHVGDLVTHVEGVEIDQVDGFKKKMGGIAADRPPFVVLRVLRGIHTLYLELEPKWGASDEESG